MKMKTLLNFDLKLCVKVMRLYSTLNENELIDQGNQLLKLYSSMSNMSYVMNDLNRLHLIILKRVLEQHKIKLENIGIAGMRLRIKREL